MLAGIIKLIARLIIGLLWARFALKLFSVADTGIISIVYRWSDYLIYPFKGIIRDMVIGGRFTVESTVLLAIVAYAFVEFILVHIFRGVRSDDY